jgi:hypothetical protein
MPIIAYMEHSEQNVAPPSGIFVSVVFLQGDINESVSSFTLLRAYCALGYILDLVENSRRIERKPGKADIWAFRSTQIA